MNGWQQFWLILGMCIGLGTGVCITIWVAALIGFLGDIYSTWQDGRKLAQFVTEKKHKRSVELLAKLIELERAKQPVPSEIPVIESQERVVNELVACQREPSPSGDDQSRGVGK